MENHSEIIVNNEKRDFKISDNGRDLSVNGQLCLPTRSVYSATFGRLKALRCIGFPFELRSSRVHRLGKTFDTFFILELPFEFPKKLRAEVGLKQSTLLKFQSKWFMSVNQRKISEFKRTWLVKKFGPKRFGSFQIQKIA